MTDVTDVPALAVEPAQSEAPDQGLTDALAGVRRRSQLVVTERWLMIAGAVVMPLGVAFTLLGWYGAAHTTRLFEQVPYLVSGGILGLGLIVIGGACYFGYWVSRQVGNQREIHDTLLRIEERLSAGVLDATANGDTGTQGRPERCRQEASDDLGIDPVAHEDAPVDRADHGEGFHADSPLTKRCRPLR